jgi:hypothetical protein
MPTSLNVMLLSGLKAAASAGYAEGQDPGKIDLEASELAAEIIGAPVSEPMGTEIGQVADVPSTKTGNPVVCV